MAESLEKFELPRPSVARLRQLAITQESLRRMRRERRLITFYISTQVVSCLFWLGLTIAAGIESMTTFAVGTLVLAMTSLGSAYEAHARIGRWKP